VVAGTFLVAVGVVLAGAAIFVLVGRARSGSDAADFEVSVPLSGRAGWLSIAAGGGEARFSTVYPGGQTNPKYWDDPAWAGAAPYGGPGMPEGFEPTSPASSVLSPVNTGMATRMRIPAIGLNSSVAPLEIVDLGDAREYETPVNTVGFIPGTASPGEPANGWYFGHLESLVQREGSVFGRLPEIARLIREDPVDIVLETGGGAYLYRVVSTRQVRQDGLAVTGSSDSRITLVTCWPPRVYDQRIVVEAELIGFKAAGAAS
jgi:sortase (surface protein transpeptidase)